MRAIKIAEEWQKNEAEGKRKPERLLGDGGKKTVGQKLQELMKERQSISLERMYEVIEGCRGEGNAPKEEDKQEGGGRKPEFPLEEMMDMVDNLRKGKEDGKKRGEEKETQTILSRAFFNNLAVAVNHLVMALREVTKEPAKEE